MPGSVTCGSTKLVDRTANIWMPRAPGPGRRSHVAPSLQCLRVSMDVLPNAHARQQVEVGLDGSAAQGAFTWDSAGNPDALVLLHATR